MGRQLRADYDARKETKRKAGLRDDMAEIMGDIMEFEEATGITAAEEERKAAAGATGAAIPPGNEGEADISGVQSPQPAIPEGTIAGKVANADPALAKAIQDRAASNQTTNAQPASVSQAAAAQATKNAIPDDMQQPGAPEGYTPTTLNDQGPRQANAEGEERASEHQRFEQMSTLQTKDWVAMEARLMKNVIQQGGSMEEVGKVQEFVRKQQHAGMQTYSKKAQFNMRNGNMEEAAKDLQKAYNFFPDGQSVKVMPRGNQLVVAPVDDMTGEMVGKPQLVSEKQIQENMDYYKDPEKFKKDTIDFETLRQTQKTNKSKAATNQLNAETALKNAETAGVKANTAAKDAGTGGTKWDSSSAQRVTSNINTRMKSSMDRLTKTANESPNKESRDKANEELEWMAKNEGAIISAANTIAKATADLDGAKSMKQAVKIKQLESKFGSVDWTIENGQVIIKKGNKKIPLAKLKI